MRGKGRLLFAIIVELIFVAIGIADSSVLLTCIAGLVLLLADWLSSCMQSKVNRFLCLGFAFLIISLLLDDVKYTLIALGAYVVFLLTHAMAVRRKKSEYAVSDETEHSDIDIS